MMTSLIWVITEVSCRRAASAASAAISGEGAMIMSSFQRHQLGKQQFVSLVATAGLCF
jgi:hypothetical protein